MTNYDKLGANLIDGWVGNQKIFVTCATTSLATCCATNNDCAVDVREIASMACKYATESQRLSALAAAF